MFIFLIQFWHIINIVNNIINFQEETLAKLESKLANVNKKVLEKSKLETTLQGENLITLIQKKEKELESYKINKKAVDR